MRLIDLEKTVRQHVGEFLCERIRDKQTTKVVHFTHSVTAPDDATDLPAIGRLRDFYDTFGSIVFYCDEKSGSAAKYIAPSSQWENLHGGLIAWIDDLDDLERSEILPDWIDTCMVIGETPRSGNYILMPTEGHAAGHVFEFDHDGFEFTEEASDIVDYVGKLLKPDSRMLTGFASHMRFVDGDPTIQWWIRQYSDHQGHVVTTKT